MAVPKIFVSSTCYDLSEVRDSLSEFIKFLGYDPILSENGDVFYHPDLHTHDSCIKEIENCHIFIVIIGGRFGGSYVYDTSKSIVNAEYYSAKKLGLPIFSFVKRTVYEDHRVFTKNKNNKSISSQIQYPSIEKQDTALKIFNFIDDIRFSQSNNSIFYFEYSKEINEILKKQFAGMLYDSLINRRYENETKKSNYLLDQLNTIAKKTEEILENVYKKIEPEIAGEEIEKIKTRVNAELFIQKVFDIFKIKSFQNITDHSIKKAITANNWWEFLTMLDDFYIIDIDPDELNDLENSVSVLFCHYGQSGIEYGASETSNKLNKLYFDFQRLSIEEITQLLKTNSNKHYSA